MPRKVAVTSLNASTLDILNTIRQNASQEYQDSVPVITKATDIPKVGEVLYGYPALANQFLSALVNRIAMVQIKSATFNNAYAELKKGYLEFGETVEEVFVNLAKAREFSPEKAKDRELKRTIPDVRTAFHAMNYRAQYPITVQDEDLKLAFTSVNGVQDLIAKIINSVTTASEYDEFLLFKYLMIKAISHGKMYPVSIGDGTDMKQAAVAYRGASNKIQFIGTKYNASGVHTNTMKEDQYIFMDADYNAQYDVNVLASAFNMDKATFSGKLKLIDNWTEFDNDRFSSIIAESDQIEAVTPEELALMKNVKCVLVDSEWVQIYDNKLQMTEAFVSSGLYWNYNLNVWKTVSSSPFSNAIVFVTDTADIALLASIKVTVGDKSSNADGTVLTLIPDDTASVAPSNVAFEQTEALTKAGIAVHKYGAIVIPAAQAKTTIQVVANIGGTKYTSGETTITSATTVGTVVTLNKA